MFTLRQVCLTAFITTTAASPLAWAQTSSGPAGQEASDKEVQEVLITGSRIARRDYQSDSPIVTIDEQVIKDAGPGTMEAVLNNMPQFAAIRTGSGLSSAAGGRNNANLRGLGAGRTLVLLDGRRMQPSDIQGAIDLNTLPEALISSVEVITGGASAAYGSDAISGVVNFRLRTDYEGQQVGAQYGISTYGDSATYDLSGIIGRNFGDDNAGNVVFAASFLKRDGTPRGERDFFIRRTPSSLIAGGALQPDATNLPSQAVLNQVFSSYGFTGNVPRNAVLGVNADGTLFNVNAVVSNGVVTVPIVNFKYGDPPYYIADGTRVVQAAGETVPLQQAQDKYNVFARGSYAFGNGLTAYGQFLYVNYNSTHQIGTNGYREPVIPITNPFIPADLRTVLASRANPNAPITYFWGSKKIDDLIVATDSYDVSQGLVGLKGRLPISDWTWDVYATRGATTDRRNRSTQVLRSAITQLLNAPDGGRSICPGGFNPFSPTPLTADPSTQACADFVSRIVDSYARFNQTNAEGSFQGSLFTLPAGELQFAAGASYRKNAFSDTPDSLSTEGLLLLTLPGQNMKRIGSDTVNEYFAELLVPVLADLPLVNRFTVNLAGRSSDYDSIGRVTTYKASGDWQVFTPLGFRASLQRAIRAPNLNELFPTSGVGGAEIGQVAQGGGDPCDINSRFRSGPTARDPAQVRALCLATGVPASVIDSFQFAGGNVPTLTPAGVALTEETADTTAVGLVLRSPFQSELLADMQLSVDVFNIKLEDAIGTITGPITLTNCFNSNGQSNPGYAGDNKFCQQITRDAGGRIIQIRTPRLNLANYQAAGVDTQLDWRFPLSSFGLDPQRGSLAFNFIASYQKKYIIQNFAGDPATNYTGTIGNAQIDSNSLSHPEWRAQASVAWEAGRFTTGVRARWIQSMVDSIDATRPGVPEKYYVDASASWQFNESISVRGGVLNLSNTQPPFFATTDATDTAIYDIVGRRFYAGVTARF